MHPPPTKLFRDEAHTASVQCPACGAPLELRGFGGVELVACPFCGTESSPEGHDTLRVLAEVARRDRRRSALPLHRRGVLGGIEWEILGIVWRSCQVDGEVYPWQEFLLFNPYQGYRYLIFSMSDGHWSLGEPLPGAAAEQHGWGHKKVTFQRTRYKHFQTVTARVDYVEGEFPWQVHVGDTALSHEYVRPPVSIAIETETHDDGQDINFTRLSYVRPREVWRSFRMPGSPPSTSGISPVQPNPWRRRSGLTWLSMALFLLVWGALSVTYVQQRRATVLFQRAQIPLEAPLRTEIEIPGDHPTTLEIELQAYTLANAWAEFDVSLVRQDRDEGLGFLALAESWSGVSDGESWREGDPAPSKVLGEVEPGRYWLEISASAGTATAAVTSGLWYDITVRQDIVLVRMIIIPLVVILFFPLLYALMSGLFELRRWSNSDYGSSE